MVSRSSSNTRQHGRRLGSRFNKIRCRAEQGQSKTIHCRLPAREPTKTAPLLGRRSGTSSAASTTATTRQGLHGVSGSHFHHGIGASRATSALERGWRLQHLSFPLSGHSSACLGGTCCSSTSLVHGNVT